MLNLHFWTITYRCLGDIAYSINPAWCYWAHLTFLSPSWQIFKSLWMYKGHTWSSLHGCAWGHWWYVLWSPPHWWQEGPSHHPSRQELFFQVHIGKDPATTLSNISLNLPFFEPSWNLSLLALAFLNHSSYLSVNS